ncbi:hypothetical protein JL721_12750 [Aureococcus anophagefferens]|nr:hypothetical protein JL721_12750 [Aureococcus anophagefferens]
MGSPAKSPLAPAESNRGDTPTTSEAAKVAMGGESPVGAVVSAAEGGDGVQEPPPVPAPPDAPAAAPAAPAAEERETVAVVDRTAGVQQCEELRGLSVAEQAAAAEARRPAVFEPGDARESCFGRTTKNLILYDKEAACASTAGLGTVYKTAAIQPKPMLELKAPPVVSSASSPRAKTGRVPEAAEFFSAYETWKKGLIPRAEARRAAGPPAAPEARARARAAKPASESAAKNWKKELVPAPSWTHVRDKLKAEEVRAACAAWGVPTNLSPGRQDRRGGDGRGSGADGGYGRDRSSYGRDRSSYDGDGDRRGGDGRGSGADGGYGRDDRRDRDSGRDSYSRGPVPRGRDRNDDDRGSYGPPPHSRDSCGYDQGAIIVRGAGLTPRRAPLSGDLGALFKSLASSGAPIKFEYHAACRGMYDGATGRMASPYDHGSAQYDRYDRRPGHGPPPGHGRRRATGPPGHGRRRATGRRRRRPRYS